MEKLGELSSGLPRAARRFVSEMVYGIPDFRYHAIADGLMSIFKRHPGTQNSGQALQHPDFKPA